MQQSFSRIAGVAVAVLLMSGCPAGSQVGRAVAPELAGTSWVVHSIDDGSGALPVRHDAAATLEFSADGRLAGTTSCNRYSAPYTLSGSDLHVGDAAVTRRACVGDFMRQEQRFLRALARVTQARLDGDALDLLDDDGAIALQATREAAD